MTRSPFGNKSQSTNSINKKSSSSIPILQLIILGMGITFLAAVFVQNLQPTVQIILFGQKTLPIPLSVAMLVALIGGGLLAFIFNAIADWRQNAAIRRAVAAAGYSQNEPKEQVKSSNPSINNPSNSPSNNPQKEELQDFVEDDYEDEEYEDEDEFYEDDEEEDEEEEDNDPNTVPYGDRKNLKSAKQSAKSNREKRDRPPLEARFIK